MADVTLPPTCTSLEPATRTCRLTGAACPHAAAGAYRACDDATFAARVSMPPDEFTVVVNAQGRPSLGTLAFRKCRVLEHHHAVAGVHVNAVLESPSDEALLRATWRMDGSVEFHCPATDVRFEWREGEFVPL